MSASGGMRTGDTLELIVASTTAGGLDFRYPTPADEARARRAAGKGQAELWRGARRK